MAGFLTWAIVFRKAISEETSGCWFVGRLRVSTGETLPGTPGRGTGQYVSGHSCQPGLRTACQAGGVLAWGPWLPAEESIPVSPYPHRCGWWSRNAKRSVQVETGSMQDTATAPGAEAPEGGRRRMERPGARPGPRDTPGARPGHAGTPGAPRDTPGARPRLTPGSSETHLGHLDTAGRTRCGAPGLTSAQPCRSCCGGQQGVQVLPCKGEK